MLSGASGSVWGAFTATTVSAGNSIVGAADWVGPQVTMLDPGTPLRGDGVADRDRDRSGGGVSTVTIAALCGRRRRRGPTVCTDSSSPYNCPLDTTALADGSYDLRAIARDAAGNSQHVERSWRRASSTTTAPSVTLAPLGLGRARHHHPDRDRGRRRHRASRRFASSASLADADTWSTVCTDTSSPYSVLAGHARRWPTIVYDFRAVALDRRRQQHDQRRARPVQVDNAVPTGVAVTAPASPLRGTVTLTATADDLDSGVGDRHPAALERTGARHLHRRLHDVLRAVLVYVRHDDRRHPRRQLRPAGDRGRRGRQQHDLGARHPPDRQPPAVGLASSTPGPTCAAPSRVQANAYAGSGVTQVAIQRAAANVGHVHDDLHGPEQPVQLRLGHDRRDRRPVRPARGHDVRAAGRR